MAEITAETRARLDAYARDNPNDIPALPLAEALEEGRAPGGLSLNQPRTPEEYQRATEARLGMPVDLTEEAPELKRLLAGMIRSREGVLDYWRKQYGQDAINLDDEGNMLAVVPTADGGRKAIPIDKPGLSMADLAELAPEGLNMIGSLWAMSKGKGKLPGWMGGGTKVLEPTITSSLGYAGTSIAQDWQARSIADVSAEDAETFGKRLSLETGTAIGVGYGLGKFGSLGIRLLNHLWTRRAPNVGSLTAGSAPAQAAIADIEATSAIQLKQTVAELMGSPLAARLEAFTSKMPFASSVYRAQLERKVAPELAFQGWLMGNKAPLSNETLGTKLVDLLEPELVVAHEKAFAARKVIESTAQRRVGGVLGTARAKSPLHLGRTIVESAEAERQTFLDANQVLWDRVRAHPEASEDVFPLKPLTQKAQSILKSLPSVPATAEEAMEAAATGAVPQRRLFEKWQPSKLRSMLDEILSKGVGEKVRLQDLQQLRTFVYDQLGVPEAIQHVGERNLKGLGHALTEAIHEGAAKLPNSQFKTDLLAASSYYEKNVDRFSEKGVRELFVPTIEKGSVSREAVAEGLFRGGQMSGEKFQTLQTFFGPKSQIVGSVKESLLAQLRDDLSDPITRRIDLQKLAQRVHDMAPEMRSALLGKAGSESVLGAAKTERAVGQVPEMLKGLAGLSGKANFDELMAILQSGSVDAGQLRALATAELKLDRLYANQVKEWVGKGLAGKQLIVPEELHERFLSKAPLGDVRAVMGELQRADPEAANDVRIKFLETLFRDVSRRAQTTKGLEAERLGLGPLEIDPQKLIIRLGESDFKGRAEAILKPETIDLLHKFAIYKQTEAERLLAGSSTAAVGGISSGMTLASLITRPLKAIPHVATYLAVALALTSENSAGLLSKGLQWAQANRQPFDLDGAIRGMILTGEFARLIPRRAEDIAELQDIAEQIRAANLPQPQPAQPAPQPQPSP